MDDLCIICPNSNWRAVVESFLDRCAHLGVRELTSKVITVPVGESRLLSRQGPQISALNRDSFSHCILLLDGDRCEDDASTAELEERLNTAMKEVWGAHGRAVIAEPSLEAWLLEGHRAFSRVPGLRGIDLRRWLSDSGLWPYGAPQPDQPRHAMERLFAEFGATLSAANYRKIAADYPIRMDHVESHSMRTFLRTLRGWFLP